MVDFKKIIFVGVTYFCASTAFGFTLFSGTNESTLPVSISEPNATFIWDGTAPKLDKKEDFEDGQYADLSDEDFFRELLTAAVGVWNDVSGSYLIMEIQEDPNQEKDRDDQINTIVVEESSDLGGGAFAEPVVSDDGDTIEDCDISVSDEAEDAETMAYILAHELGHCLGLGHNHTNYGAMMGYARSDYELRLGADDKAGLIYLYPTAEYDGAPKEFLGCAVLGGYSVASSIFLLLFPLMALFYRRKDG